MAAVAAVDHQATSFASFNDNHNHVQHIQSAPAPSKYAAPAPHHYSAPAPSHYAAPAVAKIAIPVAAKIAAPAASSYYNSPASAYVSPVASKYAYAEKEEQYGPAKYDFAYAIEDPHTGDYHSQEEHSDGGHVSGQYSLHEADGSVRIVKYSDDGHGFNAVVEKQGLDAKPQIAYKKDAAPQYFHHY